MIRRRAQRVAAIDPNIRVGIEMPASVYQKLAEHARQRKVSLSRLCRDGALREMERILLEDCPK